MTPIPKPARRGPLPRKPIARSRAPIARKRSKPKPTQRQRDERKADRAWSVLVRASSLFCQLECGDIAVDPHHLMSRRYHATRWLLANGAHLCRRCHDAVQHSPTRNEALGRRLRGDTGWEALVLRGRRGGHGISAADAAHLLTQVAQARGLEVK